jgi:predicted nucleic acid-binding protein
MARRRRAGDLSIGEYRRFLDDFGGDWERFVRIDVSEPLVRVAGDLAETHRLGGYDALQLASALSFRDRVGTAPTFASWDDDLDAAAAREGLPRLRHR